MRWIGRRRGPLREGPAVLPARLRAGDLVGEAFRGVAARPSRSLATALGTVVGVAAIVATTGIAATAAAQVSGEFDALRATWVTLRSATPSAAGRTAGDLPSVFAGDGVARVAGLNGVVHAGVTRSYPAVSVQSIPGPPSREDATVPLLAADPGALAALGVHVSEGRTYDAFHEAGGEPVALLGHVAADRLGIHRIDNLPAVWVGGRPLTVIGVIDAVPRRPGTEVGIVVPLATAARLGTSVPAAGSEEELVIDTAPGAAQVIARQGPVALAPDRPQLVKSLAPPDPRTLRGSVEGQVNALFLALAALSLLIGMIGIANTTLVAVLERVPEIGLRRALGAGRGAIAGQFLLESAFVGACGGVLGGCIGILVLVGFAASQEWAPTLDLAMVAAAPLIGTATGLLAGLQPAWRAVRIEPVDALR